MSPEPTERGTTAGVATRFAILSAICRAWSELIMFALNVRYALACGDFLFGSSRVFLR